MKKTARKTIVATYQRGKTARFSREGEIPPWENPAASAHRACFPDEWRDRMIQGDCLTVLRQMPSNLVDLVVTSPPYADSRKNTYGGAHPDKYVDWFLPITAELKRVLKPQGTFILNIKEKVVNSERHTYVLKLILGMRRQDWLWTEEFIWHKKNCYPGKWPNRFRDAWERCLQFNKQKKFHMYQENVMVPMGEWAKDRLKHLSETDKRRDNSKVESGFGKNISNWLGREMAYPANVLHFSTECGNRNHSAVFPSMLPKWFIKLFTKECDLVLDPFLGSGTTATAAQTLDRHYVGIEIQPEYVRLAKEALQNSSRKVRFTSNGAAVMGTLIKQKYSHRRNAKDFLARETLVVHSNDLRAPVHQRELLIHGDNFKAMKLLQENSDIFGKVRLVYIDPPFGTRQSFTITNGRIATISRRNGGTVAYQDELSGEAYLNFLRQRLLLIRGLMAEESSIYFHIDCKVGHYVKCLMDEVFGKKNFINDITRIKCNPKNFDRKGYGNIKDTILFYKKSEKLIWNNVAQPIEICEDDNRFRMIDSEGRRYTTTPLHAPGETLNGATGKSWRGMQPPPGRHWRYAPNVLDELDRRGRIVWSSTGNPRKKIYADEVMKAGVKIQDVLAFKDPQNPRYPTEKNLEMLKLIVANSSGPDDIVLDAFCGSGTTLLAARELGRKWIGIDASEVAISTCKAHLPGCSFVRVADLKEALVE